MRLLRYLRTRALRETHAEAQLDLRDGLLEARADRIAELESLLAQERIEKAKLLVEVATWKTHDFMHTALRLRRRQAEQHTTEPERPAQHRRDTQTEVHPRRKR